MVISYSPISHKSKSFHLLPYNVEFTSYSDWCQYWTLKITTIHTSHSYKTNEVLALVGFETQLINMFAHYFAFYYSFRNIKSLYIFFTLSSINANFVWLISINNSQKVLSSVHNCIKVWKVQTNESIALIYICIYIVK